VKPSIAETGRWNFKPRQVDMVGERYGRLVVLGRATSDPSGRSRWFCRCDCGADVVALRQTLREGDTKSCGCLRREKARANGKRGALVRAIAASPMLDALTAAWGRR